MLDAATPVHQRSRGTARVVLGPRGEVVDLFQQGSAKAMLPKVHCDVPEVVFLNTSGGLTGGDRLSLALEIAPDTTVVGATQTAERAYASSAGQAEVSVSLTVGAGAFCLWMPQETILFDRACVHRRTEVHLGAGARYLGVETLVLGRQAMAETLGDIDAVDIRRIYGPKGHPIHAEHIHLSNGVLARRTAAAGLAGLSVFANLVYIAPDAVDRLAEVRKLVGPAGQASAWNGRLVLRVDGTDSWTIRQTLIPVIEHLGTGRGAPRVWQN